MATADEYHQTWKPKLRAKKTVSAAFHLNNKEAKRELKVNHNNETMYFCSGPKYLGITLDRPLTHRRHLESLRKKLTSRVVLLRWLADSGLGHWSNNVANLSPGPLNSKSTAPLRAGLKGRGPGEIFTGGSL